MSGAKLLLILGGPGAGKSTVSSIVQTTVKNGLSVKCGQIVRKDILNTEDPIPGKDEVTHAMHQGGLVSDDVVVSLLHKELIHLFEKNNGSKFVLDGFPRTKQQITILMSKGNYNVAVVFVLQCPRVIMEKRCKLRNLRTDRVDDRRAPVDARINDFEKHIGEIKSEFASMKVLVVDIDTTIKLDLMKKQIQDCLSKAKLD